MRKFPRGSEWRPWDLHIHSPASFYWAGQRFRDGGNSEEDAAILDAMIAAMNSARPAVFALMDYWNFDGWFAFKQRLPQRGAPAIEKTVFPGIELRLCAPMSGRLNAHVIFSNHIDDQLLNNFLSQLTLELIDQPLSRHGLIAYARHVTGDMLAKHGFKKAEVSADDTKALEAGYRIAELKADSYKAAIRAVPDGMAIGFMPFTTNDGLGHVDVIKHYAYAMSLFGSSPIFEARDDATWHAFVGRKTDANAKFFDAFQEALGNVPRLPVSGSDAHLFTGDGTNDTRGYGDYPSGRVTWIKGRSNLGGLTPSCPRTGKTLPHRCASTKTCEGSGPEELLHRSDRVDEDAGQCPGGQVVRRGQPSA